jgi:gamma-glutamylcyclotransferase (GGCT)/AIG2-like uncharacterized protein YtfP
MKKYQSLKSEMYIFCDEDKQKILGDLFGFDEDGMKMMLDNLDIYLRDFRGIGNVF